MNDQEQEFFALADRFSPRYHKESAIQYAKDHWLYLGAYARKIYGWISEDRIRQHAWMRSSDALRKINNAEDRCTQE